MLAIENNRENCPLLYQIYNILTELLNQGKQLTLFKVPARIGIKGNEETDKAAKQSIYISGMTTTRLPFIHYSKNKILTIKYCLQDCPNGGIAERNTISWVT